VNVEGDFMKNILTGVLLFFNLFAACPADEFQFNPQKIYSITYQLTDKETKTLEDMVFIRIQQMGGVSGAEKIYFAQFKNRALALSDETIYIALNKIIDFKEKSKI
jgi:hypothetical protein